MNNDKLRELEVKLEALEHSRRNQYSRVSAEEYERQIKAINQEIQEIHRGR
jgi:hypothetical protein